MNDKTQCTSDENNLKHDHSINTTKKVNVKHNQTQCVPDENNLKHDHSINNNPESEKVHQAIDDMDIKNELIAKLEIELNQIKERERDSFLRLKAEMDNIRRRSEQDIEKAHKFALENFMSELLLVIDNLERALDMLDRSNSELSTTIEGIELTLKSLLNTVHKFGLEVIDKTCIPFNPDVHQAITMLESDTHEPNQVIKIVQKGYTLNNRLIRPAMVTVSKSNK